MDNFNENNVVHGSGDARTQPVAETYNETIIRLGALAFLVLLLCLAGAAVAAVIVELVRQ
jgi:hypothetical protein